LKTIANGKLALPAHQGEADSDNMIPDVLQKKLGTYLDETGSTVLVRSRPRELSAKELQKLWKSRLSLAQLILIGFELPAGM
jgi:hypothetical protein